MSVYVPPATGSSGGGCSGGCATESQLTYNYVASYFNAHCFSISSYRYQFITWIALGIVVAFIAAFHHSGIADQTWLGALWSRWAIKNRVIKYGRKPVVNNGKHETFSNAKGDASRRAGLLQDLKRPSRKVFTFPSFGRTLLLAALVIVPIVLTIVGADYIRPTAGVFDMRESWPKTGISIFTPGLSKRLEWGIGAYPRVTTQPPTITLPYRTWWTAGSRAGAMTNALIPLIVVIALKQIPFALFSTRLLGGFSFDRLSFMHKWGGRIVWLFATAHVALWCVQMTKDVAFQRTMWAFIFVWTKFRWGFVAYGFFTLLIALSIGPIREHYYEFFYISHVICVIGLMVAAWLHHPPAGYWMYVTLIWWAAERITRAIKAAWINGIFFTGRRAKVVVGSNDGKSARNMSISDTSSHTLHQSFPPHHQSKYDQFSNDTHLEKYNPSAIDRQQQRAMYGEDKMNGHNGHIPLHEMEAPPQQQRYTLTDDGAVTRRDYGYDDAKRTSVAQSAEYHSSHDYDEYSSANGYRQKQQTSNRRMQHQSQQSQNMTKGLSMSTIASQSSGPRPAMAADVAAVLRPGYAYAQLLPGKTLRLTLRTPNRFAWLPGQYINLCIPQVGFWQSHPFTIASAYNAGFPSSTLFSDDDNMEQGLVDKTEGEERTIVLLVRARRGFTLRLWEHVRREREKQIRAIEVQTGQQYIRGEVAKTVTGVHVRALIDGPYGSIQRVRWHVHSTVVIICGGSGISSGMSILEHLCSVMAGNRQVKNFQVKRVRFVWMLREYAHLQWIASALRRCIEMVPPELLQVELFVTKIDRQALQQRYGPAPSPNASSLVLNSTAAHMANRKSSYAHSTMTTSDSISMYQNSYEEGGYNYARFTEGDDQEEYEIDATDLTEFAGEDNSGPSAAEVKIGERVAKEGKLRRALTRKATAKRVAQGRIGKGHAPNRPDLAGRNFSALAHQRSVHESSRRPQNPSAMSFRGGTSPIPERDLGEDQEKETREEWEDSSTAYAGTVNELSAQPLSHQSHSAYRSTDGLLNPNDLHRHPLEQRQNSGSSTPSRSHSPQPSPSYRSLNLPSDDRRMPSNSRTSSYHTHRQGHEISSTTHLNASSNQDLPATNQPAPPPNNDADIPIDLDKEEYADLRVLAELARPGYPKLDVILREEASHSTGRVLVSACGPLTLGNLIRSVASKQINVAQIRKGHLNSHINVITESYEWGG